MKQQGKPNDLLERIKGREFFKPVLLELPSLIDPQTFIGRSGRIVERLVNTKVKTALDRYQDALQNIRDAELKV